MYGAMVSVLRGSTYGGTQWATSFKSANAIGVADMVWFQIARVTTGGDLTIGGNFTAGNFLTGTYTPSLTAVANVAASSAVTATYTRTGTTVTVLGQISITATTANTNTQLRVSLPIASNISAVQSVGGAGASVTAGTYGAGVGINGDATNDAAVFNLRPTVNTSVAYAFSFTYRIE